MNIRFGTNEYALVPGSAVQVNGNDELSIQLLAEGIDFESLETVLMDKANTENIVVVDEQGPVNAIPGYSKLVNMYKAYDVLYWTEYIEHEITPQSIDPETGEMIPAVIEREPVEHRADILYIRMAKPGVEQQVDENTANIEFIAIMSDIEL